MSVDFVFRGPNTTTRDITVTIHYELYDGLPVLGKWLIVNNGTSRVITLDRFTNGVRNLFQRYLSNVMTTA